MGTRTLTSRIFNSKTKALLGILVGGVILVGIAVAAVSAIGNKTPLLDSQGPSIHINKTLTIIPRTKDGRPTDGKMPMTITTANMTDSILVQGQTASARNGKTFLVVYADLQNNYQVALYATPLDLLRLVRPDGKRIAPSVSQGNVEIRPLSVKTTNVGFVVEPNEKSFTIEVGEIDGPKQAVQINFK